MARLKFLVFSLLVLGAWAAHLFLLTPNLSARAVEQAEARAGAHPAAVLVQVQAHRLEVQRTVLKVAQNPLALSLVAGRAGRVEAPTPEKLAELQTAIAGALPAEQRGAWVVGITNEAGTLVARGGEAPVGAEALDVAALTGAGSDGVARDAFGNSYLFYGFPVSVLDRGEAKVAGHLVLGAPLLPDGLLDTVAKQTGAGALALVRDGKVLQAAGPEKALVEKASFKGPAGSFEVLDRGGVSALGPLQLPLFAGGADTAAPLRIASRQALTATPFEIVSVASVAPFMTSLAEYQKLAVFAFAGLLALSMVFLFIMGGGQAAAATTTSAAAASPAEVAARVAPPVPSADLSAAPASPGLPGIGDLPPPPEASPDDFQFGPPPEARTPDEGSEQPSPPSESESAAPTTGDESGEGAGSPPPLLDEEGPTRAVAATADLPFANTDAESTAAYPANVDPFGAFSRSPALAGSFGAESDFNPDATKVATIPEELIRASASRTDGNVPVTSMPGSFPPPAVNAAPANADDGHFQDVYRDFVKTREQCGEAPDGLTFEKFAQKLRKNRDQLVAKYNCKTVRFQVYVKEGKAALKATPIKE